jgi:beta-lactamase regulating signal transducer with metallopeptidase domain
VGGPQTTHSVQSGIDHEHNMETHWLIQAAFANAAGVVLLAAAAFLTGRWLRSPALTHALWVLVLVKFVTPPLVGVALPGEWLSADVAVIARACLPTTSSAPSVEATSHTSVRQNVRITDDRDTADAPVAAALTVESPHEAPLLDSVSQDLALLPCLVALWLAGTTLYYIGVAWKMIHHALRLRNHGCRYASADMRAAEIGRVLGLTRVPPVVFIAGSCSPLLWGFGPFARLVFPTPLWNQLSTPCRDALLTHELAHFRRRDHWVRPLEILVTGLYWWHPVLWWARRQVSRTEEACCDAWVVCRSSVSARTYAEALLTTLDYISTGQPESAPATTGIGVVPDLKCRLTEIMRPTDAGTMPTAGRWLLALFALALPLHPSIADPALSATVASAVDDSSMMRQLLNRSLPAPRPDRHPQTPVNAAIGAPAATSTLRGWWNASSPVCWAVVDSPDGRFRLIASVGCRLTVEDRQSGTQTILVDYQITAAGFTPDSRYFVAGERDGAVRVWDAASAEPLSYFGHHDAEVVTVAVSPSGQFAASGSRDGAVMIWDLSSGVSWTTWTASREPITSVRIAGDGHTIAVSSGDWRSPDATRITLLNLRSRSLQPVGVVRVPAAIAVVEFTPGDDALLAAAWDGTVFRWDPASSVSMPIGELDRSVINEATFSQDIRFGHRIRPPAPTVPDVRAWSETGSLDEMTQRLWRLEQETALRGSSN